jgi:acyl-CoA thioesterase-1
MTATVSPRPIASVTSVRMASVPSGLLTCLPTPDASSTVSIRLLALAALLLCPALFARAAPVESPVILVVGDSLSAAYGIRVEQGWVALLQTRLKTQGYGHRVVNASSSGETTGGALARLPRALERHRPAVVIIELGGNDGLRGLPIADVRRNFDALIALSLAAGAKVLLVGMRIPPNYGPAYATSFDDLYGDLAREHRLPLVPFFLDGIALDDALMQDDGLHPNAAAQPRLLDMVWPRLQPLLGR